MENSTYALLVGIDNYKTISSLNGCVNDILKVEDYLQRTTFSCDIKKLIDSSATKGEIVRAFIELMNKVHENDTVMFYFTGHGAQEKADKMWNESDEILECLVCYDSNPSNPGEYLLADKELRYLIHKLSKICKHIVTIFDCCHSGDNTRNAQFIEKNYEEDTVRERRVHTAFQKRQWNDFIFHDAITQMDMSEYDIDTLLPQGTHIQISACESDEVAVEINGEGVFTRALITVLKSAGGNISYFFLKSRIRQYLRFIYKQQPRIFIQANSDEQHQHLLFSNFLNKGISGQQGLLAEVVFNRKNGWLLNAGAIHGINKESKVLLIDPSEPGKICSAGIKNVFIDHAIVEFETRPFNSTIDTTYKARIEGLQLSGLKLYVINHDAHPRQLKLIADELIQNSIGYFTLTDDESLADYTLHVKMAQMFITFPGDQSRPLTRPIEFNGVNYKSEHTIEKETLVAVSEMLWHISRWNFIRILQSNLANPFLKKPINTNITQKLPDGSETDILINDDTASINFYNLEDNFSNSLHVSFTNQSGQRLFVGIAYLSFNFQCNVNVLERTVELLGDGESTSLMSRSSGGGRNFIRIRLPKVVQDYNWPAYTETIKIIISDQEFDMEGLYLAPLPSPISVKMDEGDKVINKSFDFEEHDPVNLSGWLVQTLHLQYINPLFQPAQPEEIKAFLDLS